MPELATPGTYRVQPPAHRIDPLRIAPPPPPDTSKAGMAMAVANAVQQLSQNYLQARKLDQEQKDIAERRRNQEWLRSRAFGADGKGGDLTGMTISEDGMRYTDPSNRPANLFDSLASQIDGRGASSTPAPQAGGRLAAAPAPVTPASTSTPPARLKDMSAPEDLDAIATGRLQSGEDVPLPEDSSLQSQFPVMAAGEVGAPRRTPAGTIIYSPDNGITQVEVMPNGQSRVLSRTGGEEEGRLFKTPEEATAAGMDPTDAKVVPGGIRVTKFKPPATDTKGRQILTDNQRNSMLQAGSAASMLKDIEGEYDALEKGGKTGLIGGAIQEGKKLFKHGSQDYVEFENRVKSQLATLAKAFGDSGALSDSDVMRIKEVVPTAWSGREQFTGTVNSLRRGIVDGLTNRLKLNRHSMHPDQIQWAEEQIRSLGGTPPDYQAVQLGAPPAKAAVNPEVQSKARAVLQKYQSGAYDANPADKKRAEELLRKAGLL